MKSVAILFFLHLPISIYAQWLGPGATSGSGDMYYNSGKVGIGISTPNYLLDVSGDIRARNYLRMTSIGIGGEGVVADDSYGATVFSLTRNANNEIRLQGYGYLTFFTNGNTGSEKMRIMNNGNVGIGYSHPSYKLDVNGIFRAKDYIYLDRVGTDGRGIKADDGVGATIFSITRNPYNEIRFQGYGDLTFFTNGNTGTEKLRITKTGNVGIGTADPQAKFEVNGDVNLGIDRSDLNTRINTYGNKLYFLGAHENSDKLWMARYNVSASPNASELRVNIGDDPAHNGDKFVIGVSQGNNWYPRLIVQGDGKIGIGSTTPTEKLVVDGKILAEEIKVQTVPASDYVFEPDYDLMPLNEVDQFIRKNKHLPDIPSAEEFKENGVGLGEMDDMLLRKVEELTLYVIEQQKEIKELKREISQLKNED